MGMLFISAQAHTLAPFLPPARFFSTFSRMQLHRRDRPMPCSSGTPFLPSTLLSHKSTIKNFDATDKYFHGKQRASRMV